MDIYRRAKFSRDPSRGFFSRMREIAHQKCLLESESGMFNGIIARDSGNNFPGSAALLRFAVSDRFCWRRSIQGGPAKVKPLTFLLVTFECIGKIQ